MPQSPATSVDKCSSRSTESDLLADATRRSHAIRFISAVVGQPLADVESALCERVFRAISRQEELERQVRDEWGNWDWQYSDAQRRGELYLPWLDHDIMRFRDAAKRVNPKPLSVPLWPDGKRFALCLTHDVDRLGEHLGPVPAIRRLGQVTRSLIGCRSRRELSEIAAAGMVALYHTRPYHRRDGLWHSEDWLRLEDRFGFKSTFFFFPSQLETRHRVDCVYDFGDWIRYDGKRVRIGEMMRGICEAGWDVGLHGSYESARTPHELRTQRASLEAWVNRPVTAIRQHYLRYDADITPRAQALAGLQNDSTQGFNRSIGFRAGTSFPYWCWDHQDHRPVPVLEIPQIIMDSALFSASCLEYDAALAEDHSLQIMDAVEQVGGCLTLNWHADYLNCADHLGVYATLLAEGKRRNAWGCSIADVGRWWRAREARLGFQGPAGPATAMNSPIE